MVKIMNEIERMVGTLKKTFEKNAWHGPAVTETLHDISETESLNRLPNTHSIAELVLHMIAWRTFVTKRLTGDNDFQVNDAMNFPEAGNWEQSRQKLNDSQQILLQAIENFPESRLHEIVPHGEYRYTYYTLIHGIIHHDLYHAGQIALIKKATR